MLKAYAYDFVKLTKLLDDAGVTLRLHAQKIRQEQARLETEADLEQIERAQAQWTQDKLERVISELKRRWSEILSEVRIACEALDLNHVADLIDTLAEINEDTRNWERDFRILNDFLIKQLQGVLLYHVPSERAAYLGNCPLELRQTIPDIAQQWEDAGWCFATGSWTASVFHLMGVMELCLRKLARAVEVPNNDAELLTMTWGQILNKIEERANDKKNSRVREQYGECVTLGRCVRDVWRDDTIHFNRRFNQDEAKAVFEAVKSFTLATSKALSSNDVPAIS